MAMMEGTKVDVGDEDDLLDFALTSAPKIRSRLATERELTLPEEESGSGSRARLVRLVIGVTHSRHLPGLEATE